MYLDGRSLVKQIVERRSESRSTVASRDTSRADNGVDDARRPGTLAHLVKSISVVQGRSSAQNWPSSNL